MEINGTTKTLCVFGDPIAHTLSPLIHRIFIEHTGDHYVYVPFHVTPDGLGAALNGAYAMGIEGINLTIPHKKAALAHVCGLDESARLVGAVNTLKRTPDGYRGCNTDVYGFMKLIELNEIPVKGQKVLVLGAGGAASSAVAAAVLMGAGEVVIYNRTASRAEELSADFNRKQSNVQVRVAALTELEQGGFPIVFQTTSCGMTPNVDTVPVPEEAERFYQDIRYALDMVYTPPKTRFLSLAASIGHAKAVSGGAMLFYQALKAYEIWTNRTFSDSEASEMLSEFNLRRAMLSEQNRKIVLLGYMGSGKTSVGRALSEALSLPFIDLDDKIVQDHGLTIPEIFHNYGEETFREWESEAMNEALQAERCVLSLGGGTPLREENRRHLKESGVKTVYLQETADTALSRLMGDTGRPLLEGYDTKEALYEHISRMLGDRSMAYADAASSVVVTDGKTIEEIMREVILL